MAGIKIVGGGGRENITDTLIEGSDVGIEATNANITARRVSFRDVGQAWKIDGHSSADITGSRVAKARNPTKDLGKTTKGWTPSSAPALPILCGACGAISPSRHHQLRGFYFELWDNEEPCPKCGGPARISEGIFNLAKETVEALRAPEVTHAMIAALVETGLRLASGTISPDGALEQIDQQIPAAHALFARARSSGAWMMGAIIAFLAIANGYADFVKNYSFDPISASTDFILHQLLPALDTPSLQETMEPGPEGDLKSESNRPPEEKTIPESVQGEIAPDPIHKV